MARHKLSAIASRLRVNRGFDSAWFSDANYAMMLQKDWLLSRAAWSFVQRSSRSLPRQFLSQQQQVQQLLQKRLGKQTAGEAQASQDQKVLDYPNFRVGRVFIQHLPYKSYASAFAYTVPKEGPQAKYGLFPKNMKDTIAKEQ